MNFEYPARVKLPIFTPKQKRFFSMQKITDEEHGFELMLADDVKCRHLQIGYVFGHARLNGLMMMLYHHNHSMEELKTEMYAGFFDDSGYNIQVDGKLKNLSEDKVMANYKGKAEGKPARGFGIGVLSPFGGGVLAAAISTPENFSDMHMDFVEDLVQGLDFFEPVKEDGSGEWTAYLRGKTLSRQGVSGRDKPVAFHFSELDSFEAEFGAVSEKHKLRTFESGKANLKGQWEVNEVMEQFLLRLIFFDGSETQFTLRMQDMNTVLLNDEPWNVVESEKK